MKLFAPHQKDFYKADHRSQYPKGTEVIYSNFTARSGKHSNVPNSKGVLFVGLQLFIIDYLINEWNDSFFNKPKEEVVEKYRQRISKALNKDFDIKHIRELHDLGYLPVSIKAMAEGSFVPYKVPVLTIKNTIPEFYWVTNMLESVLSCELWPLITTATTYREYLKTFYEYAELTGSEKSFVPFQAHDFSYRGMFGREAAAKSGLAGLLTGSMGTDCIPAIDLAEEYYPNPEEFKDEFIAGSVSATEHSVMGSNIELLVNSNMSRSDAEMQVFKELITETYPDGIVSIVSDTFDFWNVVTEILPKLYKEVVSRNGKLVIRPDSGSPVKILCGNLEFTDYDSTDSNLPKFKSLKQIEEYLVEEEFSVDDGWRSNSDDTETKTDIHYFRFKDTYYKFEQVSNYICNSDWNGLEGYCHLQDTSHTLEIYNRTPQEKGLVECLWEIFGGNLTHKGYKVLNEKIGAIYGDSITLDIQKKILEKLKSKGFASSNVVLGVGSFSLTYVTRDSHGFAMKATSAIIDGKRIDIYKDPKTDDGTKKSAKGLLMVTNINGTFELMDQVTPKEEARGCLEKVFENGKLLKNYSLMEVRNLVKSGIDKEIVKNC